MRQRRQAERGHYATRSRDVPVVNRRVNEARVRRILIVGAIGVVLSLAIILGFGWFSTSFQPPRRTVAEIGGQTIKLGDVVPYAILDGVISGTINPGTSLNNRARDEIFRQRAADIGAFVSPAEVEQRLALLFEPIADGVDAEPPTELTAVGRQGLEDFLNAFDVTEQDYREWTKGQLLQVVIQDTFAELEPDIQEQVFLHWIVTASSVGSEEVLDRIDGGEEFAALAVELNGDPFLSDENGEVGWVPRGAIAEIDEFIFADELVLNIPMGPLPTSLGSAVLMVTDGPSEQPLSDDMRILAASEAFQEWMDQQTNELVTTLELTSSDIEWVLSQF